MRMPDDAELAANADAWMELGLACRPADRAAAQEAVLLAYRLAGLPAPERFVWLGSPAAGAYAVALLSASPLRHAEARGQGLPPLAVQARQALKEQGCADLLTLAASGPATSQSSSGLLTLGASERPLVRTRPWAQARAGLLRELGPVGFARHWAAASRRPWQQLSDQLVTPLRARLAEQFDAEGRSLAAGAREALLDAVHGQHDAGWLGAFIPAADPPAHRLAADAPEVAAAVRALAGVARHAGWWWPFERVVVLTERPIAVHRDNVGRLHHGDGAALSYPDGFGVHAWRGMPIPAEVADELPRLTVERIRDEANAEVRRVMLEHFGFDRYLRESNATQVQSDETGILWRIQLPRDEPLVMVEVINSTPEPDGTSRTYFLRVPPTVRTAREGVAWTFDLTEQDYAPLAQT